MIVSSPDLCGTPSDNAITQLRADFTNCALPAGSITDTCIPGYVNEGTNCGYQSNLDGLCTYCNSSAVNSTDSCCVTSDAGTRCANVRLPVFTSVQPLFTTSTTPATSSTGGSLAPTGNAIGSDTARTDGLSGGQIAGIVVGTVIGAAILLALLILGCIFVRRRNDRRDHDSFGKPSPPYQATPPADEKQGQFVPLGGARVSRLAAMDGPNSPPYAPSPGNRSPFSGLNSPYRGRGMATAAAAAAIAQRGKSSSEDHPDSSPNNGTSSPEEGTSGSEQLDEFKDYYSTDAIRPGDTVSTLWDYQPRARDEFALERGDMLRVAGIWDDGWATGVRVPQMAHEWQELRTGQQQRDSVVSEGDSPGGSSPIVTGEVKAFPVRSSCSRAVVYVVR